jgi:hypothetical protein
MGAKGWRRLRVRALLCGMDDVAAAAAAAQQHMRPRGAKGARCVWWHYVDCVLGLHTSGTLGVSVSVCRLITALTLCRLFVACGQDFFSRRAALAKAIVG